MCIGYVGVLVEFGGMVMGRKIEFQTPRADRMERMEMGGDWYWLQDGGGEPERSWAGMEEGEGQQREVGHTGREGLTTAEGEGTLEERLVHLESKMGEYLRIIEQLDRRVEQLGMDSVEGQEGVVGVALQVSGGGLVSPAPGSGLDSHTPGGGVDSHRPGGGLIASQKPGSGLALSKPGSGLASGAPVGTSTPMEIQGEEVGMGRSSPGLGWASGLWGVSEDGLEGERTDQSRKRGREIGRIGEEEESEGEVEQKRSRPLLQQKKEQHFEERVVKDEATLGGQAQVGEGARPPMEKGEPGQMEGVTGEWDGRQEYQYRRRRDLHRVDEVQVLAGGCHRLQELEDVLRRTRRKKIENRIRAVGGEVERLKREVGELRASQKPTGQGFEPPLEPGEGGTGAVGGESPAVGDGGVCPASPEAGDIMPTEVESTDSVLGSAGSAESELGGEKEDWDRILDGTEGEGEDSVGKGAGAAEGSVAEKEGPAAMGSPMEQGSPTKGKEAPEEREDPVTEEEKSLDGMFEIYRDEVVWSKARVLFRRE